MTQELLNIWTTMFTKAYDGFQQQQQQLTSLNHRGLIAAATATTTVDESLEVKKKLSFI
jgi:hypothetical protein